MKTVTVKIRESDLQKLHSVKGSEPLSGYVRKLIMAHLHDARNEADALQKLMSDVQAIRQNVTAPGKGDCSNIDNKLLALALFLLDVLSVANPPIYSMERDRIKVMLETLRTRIKGE